MLPQLAGQRGRCHPIRPWSGRSGRNQIVHGPARPRDQIRQLQPPLVLRPTGRRDQLRSRRNPGPDSSRPRRRVPRGGATVTAAAVVAYRVTTIARAIGTGGRPNVGASDVVAHQRTGRWSWRRCATPSAGTTPIDDRDPKGPQKAYRCPRVSPRRCARSIRQPRHRDARCGAKDKETRNVIVTGFCRDVAWVERTATVAASAGTLEELQLLSAFIHRRCGRAPRRAGRGSGPLRWWTRPVPLSEMVCGTGWVAGSATGPVGEQVHRDSGFLIAGVIGRTVSAVSQSARLAGRPDGGGVDRGAVWAR